MISEKSPFPIPLFSINKDISNLNPKARKKVIEKIRNKHNAQRSRVVGKLRIFKLENRIEELTQMLNHYVQQNHFLLQEIQILQHQLSGMTRKNAEKHLKRYPIFKIYLFF